MSALKSWLGLPTSVTANDTTLATTITAASRTIYALLSRPGLLPQIYTEVIDGERNRLFLRHWPVLQIVTVTLDCISIPAAAPSGAGRPVGYLLKPADAAPPGSPQALDIFGWRVWRERQSLVVTYQAGYAVQKELQTAPAAAPFSLSVAAPYGVWASDLGVTYTLTGAPLTPVQTTPAQGQYSVNSGLYTFAAADAGAALSLSYGFVPQDLAQAALELAAERFRASDRIGLRSKSVGGQETISYDVSGLSASILALVQPYRQVAV